MTQQVPPEWFEQLDGLLTLLKDGQEGQDGHEGQEATAEAEGQLADRLARLDPALIAFLIEQLAEQGTPAAAAFLELLAGQASLPDELRVGARTTLAGMAEQGVTPASPVGAERFLAGYAQRSRERGEQILLLGWRLPGHAIEALVFLLDWRGDGLKDFYATRQLTDVEWQQLVEHNAGKGAPLVEVTQAEGRALLEAALAESRRFSRPLPREYKITQGTLARRVLDGEASPANRAMCSYLAPDLTPEAIVAAYVAALHYRDYALAAELLAPEHALHVGRSLEEAVAALRAQQKAAPRREEEIHVTPVMMDAGDLARRHVLEAVGGQVAVERTGKRVRSAVRERYTLTRDSDHWAIFSVEPL